jgi:hypothetical protein
MVRGGSGRVVVALEGGEGAGRGFSIREESLHSHLFHSLQDAQLGSLALQSALLPTDTFQLTEFIYLKTQKGPGKSVAELLAD